jgi:LacI family transcriptional regulator
MVRGTEDAFREEELSVLVASTDNDAKREAALIDLMLDRKVDGLILATVTRSYRQAERLLGSDIPVTLVGRSTDETWAPVARVDDDFGIKSAVEHLVSMGHRRIVHLAGTHTVSTGRDRRLAFRRATKDAGLRPDECHVVSADLFGGPVGIELGSRMAARLLESGVEFSAIVAANDLLAIGCYDIFKAAKIRIPDEVSVVGFNDILLADRVYPSLTTVRVPLYEIGREAGRLLLSQMHGERGDFTVSNLLPSLVIRESTGVAPSSKAGVSPL